MEELAQQKARETWARWERELAWLDKKRTHGRLTAPEAARSRWLRERILKRGGRAIEWSARAKPRPGSGVGAPTREQKIETALRKYLLEEPRAPAADDPRTFRELLRGTRLEPLLANAVFRAWLDGDAPPSEAVRRVVANSLKSPRHPIVQALEDLVEREREAASAEPHRARKARHELRAEAANAALDFAFTHLEEAAHDRRERWERSGREALCAARDAKGKLETFSQVAREWQAEVVHADERTTGRIPNEAHHRLARFQEQCERVVAFLGALTADGKRKPGSEPWLPRAGDGELTALSRFFESPARPSLLPEIWRILHDGDFKVPELAKLELPGTGGKRGAETRIRTALSRRRKYWKAAGRAAQILAGLPLPAPHRREP